MSDSLWFPMFVDLSGQRALVVGAGEVAARRIATLARFCRDIVVVAPSAKPEVEALVEKGGIALRRRAYAPEDLDGVDIVLACTDDAALNADIARACRCRGIPVNASSDHTLCDFFFPGVAIRDSVVVGVTAGGRDHRGARAVTERIREMLDSEDR